MEQTSYGFYKKVDYSFEEALANVTAELKKEGFGILTEIDVQATLKKKLDVDFRQYKILGAGNPPFAHRALLLEEQVGLMLPCNVIVYVDEAGETVVSAIDPVVSLQPVQNQALGDLAREVQQKLKNVIGAV